MKLGSRLWLAGGGIWFVLIGVAGWQRHGALPYRNWQGQPVFPAGAVMIGVFFVLLAFSPFDRIYRWLKDKPRPEAHVLSVLHHNRSKNIAV